MDGNKALSNTITCFLQDRGGKIETLCHALNISERKLRKKRYREDGHYFTLEEAEIITRVTGCPEYADYIRSLLTDRERSLTDRMERLIKELEEIKAEMSRSDDA